MKRLISKISFLIVLFVLWTYSNIYAFQFLEIPYGSISKWVYITDDNKLIANSWVWIDNNNDGVAECYYFGSDSFMFVNTITPDGYVVDKDGKWVVDGVVQVKNINIIGNAQQQIGPGVQPNSNNVIVMPQNKNVENNQQTTANVINTIGKNISTDVTRQRFLRNAIVKKKGYEYLDKKKMGDITWNEVIRLNGRESYIVVQPGENNVLEFEGKVYKYNDDVTYTMTVYIGDEEDETYDFGTSAQKIRVEIPDRKLVTIMFNSVASDDVYVSSDSRNLYIRNGKLSYSKKLFE